LTQKGVLSETDVAGYELLNFQDVKPVSGDPEVDRLRQGYGQMRNFFSEISLDITSDPPRFTADELLNRSKVRQFFRFLCVLYEIRILTTFCLFLFISSS
jgi:hypothetical protein